MRPTRWLALCLLAMVPRVVLGQEIPAPPPPNDFSLVKWSEVTDYFKKVDGLSDRVVVRELGTTTEGRPYIAAFISSPETIANLETYRALQKRIADPDPQSDPARDQELIAKSKSVVLITGTIHSNETAATFMAMRLLHDLASGSDADTKDVIDKTILILVPSANPDGIDIVADWYARTKGKPWEGEGMPRLYHKYAGHDTNRDWFMLNLKETQILTRLLYKEWFPTLAYDVHQMGSRGARLFVPPFYDPINPNLDARIHQSIAMIGSHMAADLAAAGKKGVLTHAMYDNWWNGGNRTTPQRHNIVAVLTEAASVKLASPLFIDRDSLRGATRGFANHEPAINFVEPWPGGWWRLADIEEYERICARSILTLAAKYKDRFQRDYLNMGQDSIRKGMAEPPYAWVVPPSDRDPGTATEMVRILRDTGVKIDRATNAFEAGGVTYPAGSFVMLAAQPYRAHLKDMMERQIYPQRFLGDGSAEPPYDVAGWTLPLQMGVTASALDRPFSAELHRLDTIEPPKGSLTGQTEHPASYSLANRANDDFRVLNRLLAARVKVRMVAQETESGGEKLTVGTLLFDATPNSDAVVRECLASLTSRIKGHNSKFDGLNAAQVFEVAPSRVGLYQPWSPSMDEGWTRLVLEKFEFPYTTLHNSDIRAGGLRDRIDVLLIPSIDPRTLRDGYGAHETEPQYVGGLGREGVESIRGFLLKGGQLVCLEDSCSYAIDDLQLPIENVVKGLKTSEFYGPGSIVKVRNVGFNDRRMITVGMHEDVSAYFDRSMAFGIKDTNTATAIVNYAPGDLLESGWLLGAPRIQSKAAVVSVQYGMGRIILFGFPPQHRGQPHGTFRLLFNSLLNLR